MATTLNEKRLKAIADARAILDRAKADNGRGMTEDETRQFDAFMSDADNLKAQIDRENRLADREHPPMSAEERSLYERAISITRRRDHTRAEKDSVALAPEARVADVVRDRDVPYAAESRSERLSLGAILVSLAGGPNVAK